MTKFYHIKPRFFVVIVLSVLFIEIASFIVVGNEIGILATLSLILLTMIIGSILLRIQGISLLKNIQRELIQGTMSEYYIADDVLIIIGAILLIFPGFVSDILGISLLIKPIRTFIRFLFLSLKIKLMLKPVPRLKINLKK
uniref:FxsA cytoplasmic membrane protein n=1 Tax=Bartonella schoenbuchensis (strain DSM 13525 / NCTC 13165 / R1) TaxID=687861 RepID=E6YXN4_BARSR